MTKQLETRALYLTEKYQPHAPWKESITTFYDGHEDNVKYFDEKGRLIAKHEFSNPEAGIPGNKEIIITPRHLVKPPIAYSGPPPAQSRVTLHAPGYEKLADVLQRAFEQSAGGKGKERHATGLPFHMQPIVTGAHSYGVGGPLFQVGKKSREAFGMVQRGQTNAAVHELLGAIVYAAGAIVAIEQDEPE